MHSAACGEVVAAYSALAKAVREVNRLSDLHEKEKRAEHEQEAREEFQRQSQLQARIEGERS
eukprot:4317874-Prymnesium_polylepis.1